MAFEAAFQDRFGTAPPEDLNTGHRLTIIAAELDLATERIVNYLVDDYEVPINAVFFRYFEDEGRRYLARTWLIDHDRMADAAVTARSRAKEPWNGRDWYVSFGEYSDGRSWDDAMRYGFVSAGGGEWYSNTIRKLPIGARVFTHIPRLGYVGVGEVIGQAAPFDEILIDVDGEQRQLSELALSGTYLHSEGEEWVVPVRWIACRPRTAAFWKPGMFANQNSAARLRNRFTLDSLAQEFGVEDLPDPAR